MGKLLVDFQVEKQTFAPDGTGDGPYTITCDTGRVIVAASVWQNWVKHHFPAVALFDEGDLSDSVDVQLSDVPYPVTYQVATVYLTTAREIDLCE